MQTRTENGRLKTRLTKDELQEEVRRMARKHFVFMDATLETCDLCGNQFPIRDIIFTGVQTLCRRCNDYES